MQTVLIAGAGRSSAYLIDYMLGNAKNNWKVIVMDSNIEQVADKLNGHPKGEAAIIDVTNTQQRQDLVKNADIVISLLPPDLHILIAKDCLEFKKNLITSSYVSPEIEALKKEIEEAGLFFMYEMGLDPGIDHMSASSIINGIHRIAGSIKSFKSYCGGLVSPESDENPWHYKITWNPKNIVNSGKTGAAWLENGKTFQIPYEEVFASSKKVQVDGVGSLAYYPNRDSLRYLSLYDLADIKTFKRATLRHPSFAAGWDAVVKANLTDSNDGMNVDELTYAEWVAHKTNLSAENIATEIAERFSIGNKEIKLLEWLGLFDNRKIEGAGKMTSEEILYNLIVRKWNMKPLDKDMIVMLHQVEYERKGRMVKLNSTLVAKGENRQHSAMAKTVGLPMAILAKKILREEINIQSLNGLFIPTIPEVYVPVLKELRKYGIEFVESIN